MDRSLGNPAQRYLMLLVNVAKKCRGRGPAFDDLSQEGNAGFVRRGPVRF
jgi:DNA-directed RNA polymerase sigma subunit (sigma70/sigma32)